MNIATINFTAIPRNTCRGCMCEHERMTVCNAVGARAKECGLPACDASSGGHIYVIAGSELFGMVEQQGAATGECESLDAAITDNIKGESMTTANYTDDGAHP